MQEQKRKHNGKHHTQLVDGRHLGNLQKSQDSPVASPESERNSRFFPVSVANCPVTPDANTIPHARISTTVVRIAVARLESIPETPTFASRAVTAAKKAESRAKYFHIFFVTPSAEFFPGGPQ